MVVPYTNKILICYNHYGPKSITEHNKLAFVRPINSEQHKHTHIHSHIQSAATATVVLPTSEKSPRRNMIWRWVNAEYPSIYSSSLPFCCNEKHRHFFVGISGIKSNIENIREHGEKGDTQPSKPMNSMHANHWLLEMYGPKNECSPTFNESKLRPHHFLPIPFCCDIRSSTNVMNQRGRTD